MKTIQLLPVLLLSFLAFACGNDDVNPSDTNSTLQSGTWRVTLFSEDAIDETHYFTDYSFQFSSGGTVTATKGPASVTGSWSAGTDDSHEEVILSFGPYPFNELNEDWHVLELSSTKIRLQHISGGSGEIDLLTFEKN